MPIILFLVALGAVLLVAGRWLMRALLTVAIALVLAGIAGSVLAGSVGGGAGTALLFGLVVVLPIFADVRRVRRQVTRSGKRRVAVHPHDDRWAAMRRAAPAERRRLERMREDLDRFLALAGGATFTPESADLQVLIERRVPELIDQCLLRTLGATAAERRVVVAQTLTSLEEVAAAAERRRAELWRDEGGRFDALRARLGSGSA